MLDFFRRYQRYFFLVITVVIIISFSFFGTYSTLGSNTWREQVAFKAINGKEVLSMDVDEMALFLATDNEDKTYFGGAWGPNFLNDGVIRNDFLETGMGQELAMAFPNEIREDISKRVAKEKKYSPYVHPQAPFLSVENIWSYFAPQMKGYFVSMQTAQDGLNPDSFNSRISLFLAEKQVPDSTIRNVIRYQEKQYQWIKPDDKLNQTDFSLFGYHTLEDWFGPRFTRLVSEFIINAAILAEKQGYHVSNAEVLTDLVRNTQKSYEQNINNPNLGVTSPEEYLSEQLRRMNMDQAKAVKIWRQVLLFRRYFDDAGANALADTLANQKLHQYAHESANIDLFQLPSHLKLASFKDLQKLEAYLYAATKQNKLDPLALPQQFLEIADISKKYPELVQKRYVLHIAKVDQKTLQSRIGMRELWNWEADDQNWKTLVNQFPILGVKPGTTREERIDALDSLDEKNRKLIDNFSKTAIVKTHPEWILQSLNDAKPVRTIVGLRSQGGKMPISGLNDINRREEFFRLLDDAPIGEAVAADSPLYDYSADEQVHYRIVVLDRAENHEILTYAEASSDDTLDTVLDRILEKYYLANRGKDASLYQDDKKEWKPFKDVRDIVAEQFFQKIITAIADTQKEKSDSKDAKEMGKDQAASLRLYAYVNSIKGELEKGSSKADQHIKDASQKEKDGEAEAQLAPQTNLADQWKIEKSSVTVSRQKPLDNSFDVAEAVSLKQNAWSPLKTPANGNLTFYQMREKGIASSEGVDINSAMAEQVRQVQVLLGSEAQRTLMRHVLNDLKSKDAISLAYLDKPVEERTELDLEPGDLGE